MARMASRYSEMDMLTDDTLVEMAYHSLLSVAAEKNARVNEAKLKEILRKSLACK